MIDMNRETSMKKCTMILVVDKDGCVGIAAIGDESLDDDDGW